MFSIYAMIGHSKEFWKERRRALVAQDPVDLQRPSFTTTSDAYAHDLYQDLIHKQELEAYLEGVGCYDGARQRWAIPEAPTNSDTLLGSVYSTLRSIVRHFVNPEELGVQREVINTHGVPGCEGMNPWGYRACPTLVVRAAGPSFELPTPPHQRDWSLYEFGFSNMATYFSVKMESETGSEKVDVDEMASYARQIFRDQPNRIHVRSLIFTENHVRLFHFDRAGSQITPRIDIHKNPGTLIRLVPGLSSTNERVLGLDDSVQWAIVDGRKAGGAVMTTSPTGDTKTYPIVEQIPIARDSIRGRATTCWKVQDPESGAEYIVKDSWRPDDRSAEHELLEVVKGLPGVVQLVSFETGRGETKDMRCPTTVNQYHNRIATRVTVDSYGKPIYYFTSILQLLCAFRDAMAGHQRLAGDDVRILHRDISHNNILLGKDDATEGFRGVLIDLDMAFRGTDANPKVAAEQNIGTRLFQSLSVLESAYLKNRSPAHDYLDDLESFLYLLTYIFLVYKPDGTPFASEDEGPSLVWGWAEEDAGAAHANKRLLFGAGPTAERALHLVEEGWGPVCGTLFEDFRWWIYDKSCEKTELLGGRAAERLADPFKGLHSHRDEHYAGVLNIFDEAIQAIQAPVTTPLSPESGSNRSITPFQSAESVEETIQGAGFPLTLATSNLPTPVLVVGSPPHDDRGPVADAPPHNITCTRIPSPIPTQLRRSSRIRDLRLAKGDPSSAPIIEASRPKRQHLPTPVLPATEPRRSARLQKRRLEEDQFDAAPAKRVKKGRRVTARAR